MATDFAAAVEKYVNLIYDADSVAPENAAEAEYVKASARTAEADHVAPLVEAFAEAELTGASGKGIGIYGMNMIPSIGHQLGKKAEGSTGESRTRAMQAIREAMAVGYTAFMSVEDRANIVVQPDADLRRIWRVMTASFRGDGPKRLGLPPQIVQVVERHSEQMLVAGLREAGLLGWRAGRKGLVGRYYGFAGIFLRAGQTDFPVVESADLMANLLPDLWPYERYVEGR